MPSPGVLPPTFPPPLPSNYNNIRFYGTGTGTANFGDNKFAFAIPDPKDPAEPEQGWPGAVLIRAMGAGLEYSFDGVTVHGIVEANSTATYLTRIEGGIAVRNATVAIATFHIEAW